MDDNKYIDIIESFYKAFQERDAERMASYYHEDITFNDPAFKHLKAEHAGNMWRMLLSQADKNMKIRFSDVWANDTEGGANWEADYIFSKTGRLVKNKITAHFKFKGDKIIEHNDTFDLWKWSGMALGPAGYLLGFTSFMKNKIRSTAMKGLQAFEKKMGGN